MCFAWKAKNDTNTAASTMTNVFVEPKKQNSIDLDLYCVCRCHNGDRWIADKDSVKKEKLFVFVMKGQEKEQNSHYTK